MAVELIPSWVTHYAFTIGVEGDLYFTPLYGPEIVIGHDESTEQLGCEQEAAGGDEPAGEGKS